MEREQSDPSKQSPHGGKPAEPVEDRPNVSTVRPEDYPEADRAEATAD